MNFQKKILVIDRDQNFGDTVKKSLTVHNYIVCYECDGTSGIKSAFDFEPDLILCDVNMSHMDGYQVFSILKDHCTLKRIPFIFLKQNASIEDFRHGMNLGADDFFSKPIIMDDLVTSIEFHLHKFTNNSLELTYELNKLFELSPIGIIIFNKHEIMRANQSIKTLLKIEKQKANITIDDLFGRSSLLKIQSWMQYAHNDVNIVLNEKITLKDKLGEEVELNMEISVYTKYSDTIHFIGFFTPVSTMISGASDELAIEVCDLLKRQKINLGDHLEEKISNIVKHRMLSSTSQNNSFFTTRENQVLNLSMEGLPIKIIADRLAISSRTVEKYRTKLMEKSNAKNIVEVIVFSIKKGLIKI